MVRTCEEAFILVKFSLTCAPTLINPDYTFDLIFFSFTFEHSLATILMQKKYSKTEQPITFFRWTIRDATLRYNIIEKKALALMKVMKDFQVSILHSHIRAYVPNATLKDVLMSTDPKGR